MTAYQFSQPWLSKIDGPEGPTALEFSHLRGYLQGIDEGTIPLFNPHLLNATIDALSIGGNIDMNGFDILTADLIQGITLQAGLSGTAGSVVIYPGSASKGRMVIAPSDNAGDTLTEIAVVSQAGARTYSVPDAGGNASFVMTAGTQTIAGAKTFTDPITQNDTSNQIVLGVTNTVTINATAPAASRVLQIPDPGADALFVMSQGNQTIVGIKTFSTQLIGKGTATNDSPSAGYIGEYISNAVSNVTPAATGVYADATNVALTAGDWLVDVCGAWDINGATWSSVELGMGTASGTDGAGLSLGDTSQIFNFGSTSTVVARWAMAITGMRVSLSGSATRYLKIATAYSAGSPRFYGRISATRTR